jgi:hypothetical protein
MTTIPTSNTAWCGDCNRIGITADHRCPQRTAKQLRLRDLCDEIAKHEDINTFHWKVIFNDGVDCEYEYLNDDCTIFQVSLDRDRTVDVESYVITVKANISDDEGNRTDEWIVESISRMDAVS